MRYAIALLLAFAAAVPAQDNATIRTGANEVLLDIVVRDKKGRPVRDLKPEDIHITDEGAPQKIRGFRLVDGQAPPATPEAGAAADPKLQQLDPNKQIRLVTLVFDQLGNDARRMSRQAAMDLINAGQEQNLFYSVFTIDQRLSILQQFTNDKELLKHAVDRATSGAYSSFPSLSDKIKEVLEAQSKVDPSSGLGVSSNSMGDSAASAAMAQMQLNMLDFAQSASREQQGRAQIFSLMALVKEQTRLPGRKTLMYFSEGLAVPASLDEYKQQVIGDANRANVSIYAIDARGLITERMNSDSTDMLGQAANSSMRQATNPNAPVSPDQAKIFDKAEDAIRANKQNALNDLAESTGGFLIANTNDFRKPLRQVAEDVRSYYAVTYAPQIDEFDGSFRKIAVHVDRPDVKVQARSGYFALPFVQGVSLMAFEVPMLKALSTNPLPRAFEYHSAAMHFAPGKYAIAFEVPLENVSFSEVKESNSFHGHISVLALLKNGQGNVVNKFSRDVPFKVPADKLEITRRGNFNTILYFDAPPGRYTLESAVLDRENMKTSTRRAVLMVPPPGPGVKMSSISVIRRMEPAAPDDDPEDPMHFTGGKVTPSLSGEVSGAVSFYFVVYPDAHAAEKPQLTIQFLKDGQPVAQAQPELPPADAYGRIPYVASSSALPAGQYEIRAIIAQGSTRAEEHAFFTVQ